jgi:hypothetical protein
MNRLNHVFTLETHEKITPYRAYTCGETVCVLSNSNLARKLAAYYPRSGGKLVIESVQVFDKQVKFDYDARPVGYQQIMPISHWHTRTAESLINSRLFAPVGTLLEGVTVKLMSNMRICVIKEHQDDQVIFDDGFIIRSLDLAEVLRRRDDGTELVKFLRINICQ